jgi:hypothetical protein
MPSHCTKKCLTFWLGIDVKDLSLGVGSMCAIRALKVHLIASELDLAHNILWGPVLLPWLRLGCILSHCC